jgi:hypothetical protein
MLGGLEQPARPAVAIRGADPALTADEVTLLDAASALVNTIGR